MRHRGPRGGPHVMQGYISTLNAIGPVLHLPLAQRCLLPLVEDTHENRFAGPIPIPLVLKLSMWCRD
jgi:hypothetical protein